MNEFDLDGNHIGIDTSSTIDSVVAKSLSTIGIDLKSGRDIKLKIEYNGLNQMLQIYVGYSSRKPPSMSFLNHSITMSHTVPRWVYVGFTASTGTVPESHQLLNWVFTSVPLPSVPPNVGSHKDGKLIMKTVLLISIPLFIVFSIFLVHLGLRSLWGSYERTQDREQDIESRSRIAANVPKFFTYKQLSRATNKFNKENLLGRGGFASVYKGIISDPSPRTIAVKKISATSEQGSFYFCGLTFLFTYPILRFKVISWQVHI